MKKYLTLLSVCLALFTGTATASPNVGIAHREMKESPTDSAMKTRLHDMLREGDKDERVRIAVVVNGDENIVVEDRVKNEVYYQIRQKFPRHLFAVMKGTDVKTDLLQAAEDDYYDKRQISKYEVEPGKPTRGRKEMIWERPSLEDVDGVPVGTQPRGLADVRRDALARAGRNFGYDYVFMITFSNGQDVTYNHIFSKTTNKNVWLRIRFLDTKSGNYIYRNDIVAAGKTHNGYINGRIMERSVQKAMTEAMNDIEVDIPGN